MKTKRNFYSFRWILIVPYILVCYSLQLALPPQELNVSRTLWGMLFGNLQGHSLERYAVALQDVGFFFFIVILYGDFLFRFYTVGATYYFSKISSRTIWYRKEMESLWSKCFLFAIGYTFTSLFVVLSTSTLGITASTLWVMLGMIAFVTVVSFLLVAFTSIIALLSNSISLGVVAAFLLSCALIIQTLSQSQHPFTLFFNPFSFPSICEGTVWKNAAIKFLCLSAEAAAVWLVCRWIVQKKDILAEEKE